MNKGSKNSSFIRFRKISWWVKILLVWLTFYVVLLVILLGKTNTSRAERKRSEEEKKQEEKKLCPHYSFDPGLKGTDRKIELIQEAINSAFSNLDWKCNYCDKVIEHGKNDPRPYFKEVRPELIALAEKHLQECEKAKDFLTDIDAKKDNNLIYDDEKSLKEKGYNEHLTIEQIKSWGLINRVNLPDLREQKRVGVVKELGIFIISDKENNLKNHETESGCCSDILSFLTPSTTSVTYQNFSDLLGADFFHTFQNGKKLNAYNRIVTTFFVWRLLQKEGSWNCSVFFHSLTNGLLAIVDGESGTLSFYLALLSAYYQKPLSQEVAATGFLNIGNYSQLNHCPWCFQEEIAKNPNKNLVRHKISLVGGLSLKTTAAVQAGVKKLILSAEQKEDYEKNVPREIKDKLTVYYVKNVEELEKLFWKGEFS